jgi:hypothetical protein
MYLETPVVASHSIAMKLSVFALKNISKIVQLFGWLFNYLSQGLDLGNPEHLERLCSIRWDEKMIMERTGNEKVMCFSWYCLRFQLEGLEKNVRGLSQDSQNPSKGLNWILPKYKCSHKSLTPTSRRIECSSHQIRHTKIWTTSRTDKPTAWTHYE